MPNLTYPLSTHLPSGVNLGLLLAELNSGVSGLVFSNEEVTETDLECDVDQTPSSDQLSQIDSVLAAHDPAASEPLAPEVTSDSFGSYFKFSQVFSPLSTNSDVSFITQNTLNTPVLPNESSAMYRIGWYYSWSCNSTSRDFISQVTVDGTAVVYHLEEPKDSSGSSPSGSSSGTDQHMPASGFVYLALSAGAHTIELQLKSSDDGTVVTIYASSLEFWKVQ